MSKIDKWYRILSYLDFILAVIMFIVFINTHKLEALLFTLFFLLSVTLVSIEGLLSVLSDNIAISNAKMNELIEAVNIYNYTLKMNTAITLKGNKNILEELYDKQSEEIIDEIRRELQNNRSDTDVR